MYVYLSVETYFALESKNTILRALLIHVLNDHDLKMEL